MHSSEIRSRLEQTLGEIRGRRASGGVFSLSVTDLGMTARETVCTGIREIDTLSGGLPRGGITEVSGARSSGGTSLMLSLFATLTAGEEVVGLVDPRNAFDPASAAAFGVVFERLVWIRGNGFREADPVLKITDLLAAGGGFGLIAVDLSDLPLPALRRVPPSVWFRLQRRVEHTPTILFFLSPEPVLEAAAALVLRLDNRGARWTPGTLGGSLPNAAVLRSRHARSSEHRSCRFRLDHSASIEAGCTEYLESSGAISS